jgi:20S proteasome subunit beta 2
MIKRELELVRLNTHTENRVQHAAHRLSAHVFGYGGNLGTYLIVGGVDCKGPQLIEVHADGNAFSAPYHTTGSGSMCAMGIIENRYRDDLGEEEAKEIMI